MSFRNAPDPRQPDRRGTDSKRTSSDGENLPAVWLPETGTGARSRRGLQGSSRLARARRLRNGRAPLVRDPSEAARPRRGDVVPDMRDDAPPRREDDGRSRASGSAMLRYGAADSHGAQASHGRGPDADWTGDVRLIPASPRPATSRRPGPNLLPPPPEPTPVPPGPVRPSRDPSEWPAPPSTQPPGLTWADDHHPPDPRPSRTVGGAPVADPASAPLGGHRPTRPEPGATRADDSRPRERGPGAPGRRGRAPLDDASPPDAGGALTGPGAAGDRAPARRGAGGLDDAGTPEAHGDRQPADDVHSPAPRSPGAPGGRPPGRRAPGASPADGGYPPEPRTSRSPGEWSAAAPAPARRGSRGPADDGYLTGGSVFAVRDEPGVPPLPPGVPRVRSGRLADDQPSSETRAWRRGEEVALGMGGRGAGRGRGDAGHGGGGSNGPGGPGGGGSGLGRGRAERRRRVELASLGTLLVLIMFTASAVWLLRDRSAGTADGDEADPTRGRETSEQAADALAKAPLSGAEMIVSENAKPGSPEWLIEDGDKRPREIEGFTDKTSSQRGETVRLFVTTEAPGYEVIAYRLGFYGGVGAREVWRSGAQTGFEQPECLLERSTRMVDCSNWSPSLSVTVDDEWVPGQYLFKLVPTEGSSTYVAFVVRDDEHHSDVLVVSDVTTLQAYNTWGGYSLYTATEGHPGGRATVVSFDRPMDMYWGQSGTLGDSFNIGQLVESLGLDVSYATNIDQHLRPELMRNHKAIVTGFHDEYYTLEMRNGLEAARDSGVNIAFLGANAVYRRIRLEPSPLGEARHEVNYRSASADPLDGVDPERVTTSWREGPAARPESSLTGTYYECNQGGMEVDMVIVDSSAWMFAGTNVRNGQRWPDVVSEEYDRVTPSAPTPGNIQVLAHSPLNCRGNDSYSDMAYYTTSSGAGVFNSGTLGFEPRLGPVCPPERINPTEWECQLRQMMANIVTEFAKGPAGRAHPARNNLAELGIS